MVKYIVIKVHYIRQSTLAIYVKNSSTIKDRGLTYTFEHVRQIFCGFEHRKRVKITGYHCTFERVDSSVESVDSVTNAKQTSPKASEAGRSN